MFASFAAGGCPPESACRAIARVWVRQDLPDRVLARSGALLSRPIRRPAARFRINKRMSDLFEAPAEPTTPAVDASEGSIGANGADDRIAAASVETEMSATGAAPSPDDLPPPPTKRASRRTGSQRSRAALAQPGTHEVGSEPVPRVRPRRTKPPADLPVINEAAVEALDPSPRPDR